MSQDIFQEALKKNSFELSYELVIDGNVIPVKLKAISRRKIAEAHIVNTAAKIASYPSELKKEPYDEMEWKKHIDQIQDEKVKEERKKNPPESRAHQIAENFSIQKTVLEIIPEYLLNSDGKPLLKTEDNKRAFREYAEQNDDLFMQVMQMYLDILGEYQKIQDTAKN